MKKIKSDLTPKFQPGEIIQDQFVFEDSFVSDINVRKVRLLCTICGTSQNFKEANVLKGAFGCRTCAKANYEKIVLAAEAISHRVCRGCKKLLPKENFRPRIGCKNYINPWCRECEVAKFKYPENLIDPVTGLKRCPSCQELLPRRKFQAHPYNPDGLKSWCEKCNRKHYNDSLVRKGLRLSDEEKKRIKEEKAQEREEAKRQLKIVSEKTKELRRKEREAFLRAKIDFYKDPLNKNKPYLFDNWKKGYYN